MIPYAHNPFKVSKEFIDYTEYKEEIEEFIEKYISPFKEIFSWIDVNDLQIFFWKMVEEVDVIHPNNWKVNFSYLIGRILSLKALLQQRKIIPQLYQLNLEWFDYLVNRFIPHITNISKDFLSKIYSGIPIMELSQAKSLLKRMVRVYGTSDLYEILQDSNIDNIDKIRAFDEFFRLHYGYFLTRCQHIGEELNRLENPQRLRNWGSDLYKIFFLKKKHAKTPPMLVEETLIELIHVRNAASHIESGGIHEINNTIIKILDITKEGKITFERILVVEELWKYYYELINMDRVLDMFSLFIQVCLQLKYENDNNVIIFICSCGETSEIYVPPNKENIICSKCFKIYKTSDLRKYKL